MKKLALMVQILGTKSKQQAALNIRSANPRNPSKALRLILKRLDSRFGSPESIESSLESRVSDFPTLKKRTEMNLLDLQTLILWRMSHDQLCRIKLHKTLLIL